MYLFLSRRSEKEAMSNNSYGSDLIDSTKIVLTSKVRLVSDSYTVHVSSNDEVPEFFSGNEYVSNLSLPYVRDTMSKHQEWRDDILRNHGEVPEAFIVLPVPKHYLKKIMEFLYEGRTALSSKEEEEEFLVYAEKVGLRNIDWSFPEKPNASKNIVVTITSTTNKTMEKSSNSSNNIVSNSFNAQPRNMCINTIEEEGDMGLPSLVDTMCNDSNVAKKIIHCKISKSDVSSIILTSGTYSQKVCMLSLCIDVCI